MLKNNFKTYEANTFQSCMTFFIKGVSVPSQVSQQRIVHSIFYTLCLSSSKQTNPAFIEQQ